MRLRMPMRRSTAIRSRSTIDQVPIGRLRRTGSSGGCAWPGDDSRARPAATTTGRPRPALLLRTGAGTTSGGFPDAIPVLADDVPEFLHVHGIQLLGVDVPSVGRRPASARCPCIMP